jgi:DNA-binding transcriptional ArsR family regulator
MASNENPRVALLRELADPLRLRVVDRLAQGGPATVSELGVAFETPLPRLSNHLRRLREAGLVEVEQRGRHSLYRVADPGIARLLQVLDHVTGSVAVPPPRSGAPSRTCYDHLAGPVGVGVYAALVERGALAVDADGDVSLGPAATELLPRLGIEPAELDAARRRFGFECFDATEHRPHLAGALGDALAASFLERGWLRRGSGRVVEPTPSGKRALRRALDLEV